MNFLHRHQWIEARRAFTRPSVRSLKNVSEDTIERMAFGVTSIELRCACGDVKERQLLGNHVATSHANG